MNTKFLKILTIIAFVVMVGANYLAVSLPLGGRDTKTISDSYPNLFAPAGYTFSIWGLIYTLLGIYVVYQLTRNKDGLVSQVNRLFIVNAFLNATWIVAWHYNQIGPSVLVMLGLLVTLIKISELTKKKASWPIELPFRVYFGWITVATIANITVFLVSISWDGWGLSKNLWAVLIIIIGALIGSWRLWLDKKTAYGLVLLWAYSGILSKHLSLSGFDGKYPEIITTTSLCILLFTGLILFINWKKEKK